MQNTSPFVIGDLPGFSPQISRLVVMMNYVRQTTMTAVRGLSLAQLDYVHDDKSNTIGALLAHIAALEVVYHASNFEERVLTREEQARWGATLELGQRARREISGRTLEQYSTDLAEVRATTLREFARRDDRWLEQTTPFWNGLPANNYFKWFHVFEDELNHRGQIRWLRRRVPAR